MIFRIRLIFFSCYAALSNCSWRSAGKVSEVYNQVIWILWCPELTKYCWLFSRKNRNGSKLDLFPLVLKIRFGKKTDRKNVSNRLPFSLRFVPLLSLLILSYCRLEGLFKIKCLHKTPVFLDCRIESWFFFYQSRMTQISHFLMWFIFVFYNLQVY